MQKPEERFALPVFVCSGVFGFFRSFRTLQQGVLGGFGHAELENRLGRNLNGCARGRVATHAGIAVLFNKFSETREAEFAGTLHFGVNHLDEFVEHFASFFFADAPFLGEVREHLGLGHLGHTKDGLSN